MDRLAVVLIALLLGGCGVYKPYESVQSGPRAKVTIMMNNPAAKMDVVIFEPDENCKFQFMGRVMLEKEELARTIFMPAKRSYFRVSAKQTGYYAPDFQDVSFMLAADQEYRISYEHLGEAGYHKIRYAITYTQMESADRPRKSVEVDHFSICKREKNIAGE